MSYLVLARKWRPRRFEDVVGQKHVARVLTNSIANGRIAHCYLFTGVRGVGKTSAARILARALNCEKGPTAVPCDECTHCAEINEGRAIDVYEIDGASNRGIDEVRQIIENVRYQPAQARFKIYIIDEVHQVTKDAFNALLKTLEEPPPFVKFILATTEVHRLPETILSRCQRFDFRRISVHDIHERLRQIAAAEGLSITEGALMIISREAQGSMRDAQSLLEQVLSFAASDGPEGWDGPVDESLLLNVLGVAERQVLYEISRGVIEGEPRTCLEMIARVADKGVDLTTLSRELVEHFRNLLVIRVLQGRGSTPLSVQSPDKRLLDLTDEELEALQQQAAGIPVETLTQYYRLRAQDDEIVARSAHPRFDLEVSLVRLATMPHSVDVVDALKRLERIQGELTRSENTLASAARAATDSRVESSHPDPPQESDSLLEVTPQPESGTGDDAPKDWRAFLQFVSGQKKFLAVYLQQAEPLEVSETELKVGIMDRAHLRYLQDNENFSDLKELAQRFFSPGVVVTLHAVAGRGVDETASEVGESDAEELVQEALRIFGGSLK
jgi:DNA polymerase III subunit gamma/tau